jgi:hypothetical protein
VLIREFRQLSGSKYDKLKAQSKRLHAEKASNLCGMKKLNQVNFFPFDTLLNKFKGTISKDL